MANFQRILVPVDFSEPSRAALETAIEIARRWPGSVVTVLHVYGVPVYAYVEGTVLPPQILSEIAGAAQDAVVRLCAEYADRDVKLRPVSELGTPMDIVRRAEEDKSDLIVIGTHGRTGLPHMVLGSVAERVVRHAPCPVLTVRGQRR